MEKLTELQNEALAAAAEHIRQQRKKSKDLKTWIICACVLLCVAMVCATVLGCCAIVEQQKTIRMQSDVLTDLLSGAEIVTEEYTNEADSGDGGTAIAGNGNMISGGDLNGDS